MSLFTGKQGLRKGVCSLWVFTFLAGYAASAFGAAQESVVPTNFQVLEKISAEAAREIVARVAERTPTGIILVTKVKGAGDADFIFDDALVSAMKGTGLGAAPAKPNIAVPDSVMYELTYRIIRLSLTYSRIWRHHWFGAKAVDRLARATVRAQLIERRTGSVVMVIDSQKQYDDTIPYSLLGTVEEKQYEFTRPAREEFKMAKYVEPIVVAGIVTGLVYLFFSNQSNK